MVRFSELKEDLSELQSENSAMNTRRLDDENERERLLNEIEGLKKEVIFCSQFVVQTINRCPTFDAFFSEYRIIFICST